MTVLTDSTRPWVRRAVHKDTHKKTGEDQHEHNDYKSCTLRDGLYHTLHIHGGNRVGGFRRDIPSTLRNHCKYRQDA